MTEEVQNPEAVLAELRRVQDDMKKLRADYESAQGDLKQLREDAAKDEWRTRALLAETKVALTGEGIKNVDTVMKYVSTDGLDFDEEGKVTGLDERLKQWQKDLPEVFDPKRRAGGKGDIFGSDPAEAKVDPLRAAVHRTLTGE